MALRAVRFVPRLVRTAAVQTTRRSFSQQSSSFGGFRARFPIAVGAGLVSLVPLYYIYNSKVNEPLENAKRSAIMMAAMTMPTVHAQAKDDSIIKIEDPQSQPAQPPKDLPRLHAKYVLVGGGTASFSALRAILRADPDAEILIISDESVTPYQRPPLSKELWFSEDPDVGKNLKFKDWVGQDKSLVYESDDFYYIVGRDGQPTNRKVKIILDHSAVRLDVDQQVITLDNGQQVLYNKLLLATGGKPKVIPFMKTLPPSLKDKITTFRKVKDFQQLDKIATGNKHIAIIGGGFLGSELACALARRGKSVPNLQVTQIFPEYGNMGLVFPRYLTEWTTNKLKEEGVNVLSKNSVQGVSEAVDLHGNAKVVLNLTDGSQLVVDHVVVAVGLEPNVDLARAGGLEIDDVRGGIVANSYLQARDNIYVAGDVSSYHDVALGRRRVEHHDHAVLSGRAAGDNMAGANRTYIHQSMFWSDLGPKIGYEAVGVVDANLLTVGVWAKATAKDTPQQAAAQDDNVRNSSTDAFKESSGDAVPESAAAAPAATAAPAAATTAPVNETYGKGIVYYIKDKKVVGVLLWNNFNKVPIARKIIKDAKTIENYNDLAKLIRVD